VAVQNTRMKGELSVYLINESDRIHSGLKQIFERKFIINISRNEIIKMKNSGYITDKDLDVAKFLFEFRFARLDQIQRLLKEDDADLVQKKLNKLMKQRIINRFMLSNFEVDKVENDALFFYCLDVGGIHLLSHYSGEERVIDWSTALNMMSAEIIAKYVSTTDVYLRFMDSCPTIIESFRVNPELRVGKKTLYPSFEITIKQGVERRIFIGEVVKEFDLPIQLRDRMFKFESIFKTNALKKYYYDATTEPVILIIADDDELGLEASKLITSCTEITNFRVSTEERMKKKLHTKGAFLKYEDGELKEITAQTFKELKP
jgi:hypothetical protein